MRRRRMAVAAGDYGGLKLRACSSRRASTTRASPMAEIRASRTDMIGVVDRVLDRARLRRAPGRPDQVHLAVTDRCFLPCLHCDIWKNETPISRRPSGPISSTGSRRGVCAGGNELQPGVPASEGPRAGRWPEPYPRALRVANTNGWPVTPKRAQAIFDAGVSIAHVSLDGIDAKTVDQQPGSRKLRQGHVGHRSLRCAAGSSVVIAAILHAGNAAEMPRLLQSVKDRGLQQVQPLYQNFGDNAYDPDHVQDRLFRPRTEASPNELDEAIDVLVSDTSGGSSLQSGRPIRRVRYTFDRRAMNGTSVAGHSDLSIDALVTSDVLLPRAGGDRPRRGAAAAHLGWCRHDAAPAVEVSRCGSGPQSAELQLERVGP